MVEKIKAEGLTPSVLIAPEVKVALREFFTMNSKERMAFLHGDINEDIMQVSICDITIPPQVSGASTVSINQEYDPAKFFDYHDEFKARHKKHPFIGQAHSFTGGAHHSGRDDNTDSLHGTDAAMNGDRMMFVSITASSIKTKDDFRCDVIVTPRGMPQYNIVHEDVEWKFLADSERIKEMLKDAEERVSATVYTVPPPAAGKEPKPPGPKPVKGKKETVANFDKRLISWNRRKWAWEDAQKDTPPTKGGPKGGGSKNS